MGFRTSLNGPLIQRSEVGSGGLDGAQKVQEPNELYDVRSFDYNSSMQSETLKEGDKYQRKKWK